MSSALPEGDLVNDSSRPAKDDLLDFDRYRSYLLLLAQVHGGKSLQARCEPADLVQQTLLRAHAARAAFRGTTDNEMRAWLRRILASVIAQGVRDLARPKRDMKREQQIVDDLDASSCQLDNWACADETSPSNKVQRREQLDQLAACLTQLSDNQRMALILHFSRGWTLSRIAEEFGSTRQSVLGLVKRASVRLRELMGDSASG